MATALPLEIYDALAKELATKADLQVLKADLQVLKTGLEGKIEKLSQKFNFMIILSIIALTLMNPVMADVIKGFLK